jgi:thioesterase domain-containing protein
MPSSLSVALFRASAPLLSQIAKGSTYGWNDLAEGEVQVHIIPGNHDSITTEPLVRGLAKALSSALDAVQGMPRRVDHAKQ